MKKLSINKLYLLLFIPCCTLLAEDVAATTEQIQKTAEQTVEEIVTEKSNENTVEYEIVVTNEQGEIISEIITTMGSSSVIGLGFKKNHLKALGKKINGVGSLQFLGYIFSKDDLKKHMVSIRKSSMKWNGFMDGIKPGLNKIEASRQLYEELPGFATRLQVQEIQLKQKAEARDWHGFVTCLVKS